MVCVFVCVCCVTSDLFSDELVGWRRAGSSWLLWTPAWALINTLLPPHLWGGGAYAPSPRQRHKCTELTTSWLRDPQCTRIKPPQECHTEVLTGNTGVGCCMDGGNPSPLLTATGSTLKDIALRPRPRPAIAAAYQTGSDRIRGDLLHQEQESGSRS